MSEIWLPVAGFEGLYEVSNTGFVRNVETGYISSQSPSRKGYKRVCLCSPAEKKTKFIHRVVAEAFIPKVKGKTQINHKDGNKTNNHVSNLEWCTPKENSHHAHLMGFIANNKGERHGRCKLLEDDVRYIKQSPTESNYRLAARFGVSVRTIWDIKHGRSWKHLTIAEAQS